MANPYSSVSVSGYNANPPSDDGSETEANRLKWSTIKAKLPDPLKAAIESVNTNVGAAFGKVVGGAGIVTTAGDYTIQASDQGKLVVITASGTLTTPDAGEVGAPFVVAFKNAHSGDITLDGSGSQTIDGAATITVPAGKGGFLFTDGSNWRTSGLNWDTSVLPAGHLYGLTLANGNGAGGGDTTNDITIAAGRCRDSTNTVDLVLPTALTKQIDSSWAVGNNAGGRSSSGLTDGTWYPFLIGQAGGAAADVIFHDGLDPSAVLPTDYLYFRRIGAVLRESSALVQFVQDGDRFSRKAVSADISANAPGTSAVTRTLKVPLGLRLAAILHAGIDANTAGGAVLGLISDLACSDEAPDVSNANIFAGTASEPANKSEVCVMTNTSGQVRSRVSFSSSSVTLYIGTRGWIDRRGRDA